MIVKGVTPVPAFGHPLTIEIRSGPLAIGWPRPYRSFCNVTVQHDMKVHVSGLAQPVECPGCGYQIKVPYSDMMDGIREIRRLGMLYGWTDIIWEREKADGTRPRTYPIVPKRDRLPKPV